MPRSVKDRIYHRVSAGSSEKNSALRFITPVIIENLITVLIGLIFSSVIGGISQSSLAAVGFANSAAAVITGLLTVVTTGSAVLTAQYVGKGDSDATGDVVEQSLMLSVLLGGVLAALCFIFTEPIMRVLIGNADPELIGEAALYFRLLMLSFPFLSLFNAASGILRATGESRAPMMAAIIQNVIQIVVAYLLVGLFKLEVLGAGLSYLICRVFGTAFIFAVTVASHKCYVVEPRRLLRPNFKTLRLIMRVGLPATVESVSIQVGYLVGNAMVVGICTYAASVYQVVNTVYTFCCFPQTITIAITVTFVGQALGAGDFASARRKPIRIMAATLIISYAMAIFTALIGSQWSGVYTDSPEVQAESARILWLMLLYIFPAVELNAIDPAIRSGGDTRFVMLYTSLAIWLVRLPLTYLFCYVMDMGASGAFLANIINLYVRSACSLIRFIGGKWMKNITKTERTES